MVNEFIDINSSSDTVFITSSQSQSQHHQPVSSANNSGGRLSWKFFDNITLLDDQLREEESEKHSNYADERTSTEGLVLLSNSNLYQSSGYHHQQQPVSVMNSSSSAANTNHHHQHGSNNNNKPNTNNNNNNNNNNSTNSRNDTMIGPGSSSTTHTHHVRGGHGHATGADTIGGICGVGGGNIVDSDVGSGIGGGGGGVGFHLGLYGWRKKCLYILILGLMILIIVNLVLTLWILKVMEFSSEGMGQLRIVAGGIQLSGQALVLDLLRASAIRSRHGQPISIESSRNFSINTRDSDGFIENHLFLGHDKLECLATGFRINDTHGGNLFSVNRNEVSIGAHTLRIDGEGGAVFRESIQTSHIKADPGRELRLESPTRQLEMVAVGEINLQTRAGLEVDALKEIRFTSTKGSIRLDSPNIILPNLRMAQPPSPGSAQSREHIHKVYQLCACFNGKLFLASPHSICAGDDTTVCR